MTVCKEQGYDVAKFVSGGDFFSPHRVENQFSIYHLECGENDTFLVDCFASGHLGQICQSGTGAGVVCGS